ncbi:myb-related transcription factor%2C partner of profilin-like [Xyrichtys novacula]|uniref:Myb-related transcription factor, partner of profilin-like n=1 Tax=Xyrichtys novacula TaxID=13765 RepID=A0AAV1HF40_XYRNO|nr:myb-related transcription factor%2C partner of profilin-like [Xyrichtys novacula]
MEETSARQLNFSQEETDVLVREVQSRSGRIYGHANRPPWADDAKAAWEEEEYCCQPRSPGCAENRCAMQKAQQHHTREEEEEEEQQQQQQQVVREEEKEGEEDEDDHEEEGEEGEEDQGEPEPVTQEGAGHRHEPATRGRRRNRVQREDQPFLETQRAGFQMLERELGSMGARLGSLEAQVKLFRRSSRPACSP